MSEKYTVVHKKSKVLVEGSPKLPSASTIGYGEIAINYADGHETLSIKNSSDKIATFSSDSTVNASLSEIRDDIADIQSAMTEDELVIATSLNDLNDRIDNINVPQNTSDLTNDSGFITGYTETDPTVPSWAKAASKPTYTASEVGAMATSERGNYSTTSHTHTAAEVGAMATSERSNYSTTAHTHSQYATTAHTHTAAEVGAMATSERSNYSTTAHTHTAEEVGAMATSERSNYLTTATTIPNVDNYFDSVEYDSNSKRINFKHGATVKGYVDASSFIKDGMVSSVTVSNGNLVVTFNTEAGREDITLALTEIFNPNNYYTKTDADGKFLTGYTETDPTVPAWAKAASKPSYTAAEVGAMATSERSNYSTTAHTHTAAEVGAMATSERSNYLTTATTIPTETTIAGSGFTKNGITEVDVNGSAITISDGAVNIDMPVEVFDVTLTYGIAALAENQYTITTEMYNSMLAAAENGKLPVLRFVSDTGDVILAYFILRSVSSSNALVFHGSDPWKITATYNGALDFMAIAIYSEGDSIGHQTVQLSAMNAANENNYSLTSHTHTAAEVGAMATSERSNYLTTATTIPTESTIAGSGFTKNAITGINVNGTAATITNGVAEINVQGGGGSTLPSVTAADNGKVLMVVNGAWAVVMPTTVYTGTDTPLSSIGNDGDIYLQTS